MKLNTVLSAFLAAGTAFAVTSAQAVVFPDFKVDPSAYSSKGSFTADKITGNYTEVYTFGATAPNSFDVSLLWNAGQFVANDGTTPVNNTGLTNDYGIYALFQGSGTVSTSGTVTTFNFTPSTGKLNVFIDVGNNDTFTAPANGTLPYTVASGGAGDVQIVMDGKVISGQGRFDTSLPTCGAGGAGINCGSFGQTTNFPLTLAGSTFFFDPKPFYGISFQSGQLNSIDTTPGTTQRTNGSLDVVFQAVPEPTSLALVGLSLLGLCFAQRRKS